MACLFFLPKRKKWAKKKIVCSTPPNEDCEGVFCIHLMFCLRGNDVDDSSARNADCFVQGKDPG